MRSPLIPAIVAGGLLVACAGESSIKSAEILDERTGVTVGALQAPLEFVESSAKSTIAGSRRISFAYLGPVEWDRSGEITYALWIHVAPGNDQPVGDIRARGALTLLLDGISLVLEASPAPAPGHGPYQPVASWGQTAYFAADIQILRRIAASRKLELEFRGDDSSTVVFNSTHATQLTLTRFLQARGITAD